MMFIIRGIGSGYMVRLGVFTQAPSDEVLARLEEVERRKFAPHEDSPFIIRVEEVGVDADLRALLDEAFTAHAERNRSQVSSVAIAGIGVTKEGA